MNRGGRGRNHTYRWRKRRERHRLATAPGHVRLPVLFNRLIAALALLGLTQELLFLAAHGLEDAFRLLATQLVLLLHLTGRLL